MRVAMERIANYMQSSRMFERTDHATVISSFQKPTPNIVAAKQLVTEYLHHLTNNSKWVLCPAI